MRNPLITISLPRRLPSNSHNSFCWQNKHSLHFSSLTLFHVPPSSIPTSIFDIQLHPNWRDWKQIVVTQRPPNIKFKNCHYLHLRVILGSVIDTLSVQYFTCRNFGLCLLFSNYSPLKWLFILCSIIIKVFGLNCPLKFLWVLQ